MKLRFLVLSLVLVGCPRDKPVQHEGGSPGPYALYTVQWGDSLWWIATQFDTPGGYKTLARLNDIRDPDFIWVGDRLKIPVRSLQGSGLPPWPDAKPYKSDLRACASQPLPAPAETRIQGCAKAACLALGGFDQVCSCAGDEGTGSLLHVRNGAVAARLTVPMTVAPMEGDWQLTGTPNELRAFDVQLDEDGPLEHVVGYRYSDEGAGLTHWQVWALDGDGGAQPLAYTAGHFGPGSFAASERGSQCDLLGTEWALAEDEQHMNSGWNLVLRRYRYDAGALVPVAAGGVPTRRLLYSWDPRFVDVRGLPMGDVVGDFSGGQGFLRPYEPSLETDYAVWGSGVLTQVERLPAPMGGEGLRLTWNGGPEPLLQESLLQDTGGWRRLGDGRTGLLYPPGYLPAQPEKLTRRPARLVHYGELTYEPFNVLWLDAS